VWVGLGHRASIAPLAAFPTPDLAPLAQEFAAEIDAAHSRAAGMSYDDALAFAFDTIDRLIAEHGPSTAVS
jgi:hypothetical protein